MTDKNLFSGIFLVGLITGAILGALTFSGCNGNHPTPQEVQGACEQVRNADCMIGTPESFAANASVCRGYQVDVSPACFDEYGAAVLCMDHAYTTVPASGTMICVMPGAHAFYDSQCHAEGVAYNACLSANHLNPPPLW